MRKNAARRRRMPPARKIAVVVAVAVLAAACAVAVRGVLGSGESDQAKALRVLRADRAVLYGRLGALGPAPDLTSLRNWGDSARSDAGRLSADAALEGVKDPAVADSARAAHQAMIDILEGFGALAAVDERRLNGWDAAERETVMAVSALEASAPAIAAIDTRDPLRLSGRGAEAVLTRVSDRLTSVARSVARRERRVANAREARERALQAALDYRDAVAAAVSAAEGADATTAAEGPATLAGIRAPSWARTAHARLGRALSAYVAAHSGDALAADTGAPRASAAITLTAAKTGAPTTRPTAAARAAREDDALDAALADWSATAAAHIRFLSRPHSRF